MSKTAWMKNGFPILNEDGKATLSDECCCSGCFYGVYSYPGDTEIYGPYQAWATDDIAIPNAMNLAIVAEYVDDNFSVAVNGVLRGPFPDSGDAVSHNYTGATIVSGLQAGDIIRIQSNNLVGYFNGMTGYYIDARCAQTKWISRPDCTTGEWSPPDAGAVSLSPMSISEQIGVWYYDNAGAYYYTAFGDDAIPPLPTKTFYAYRYAWEAQFNCDTGEWQVYGGYEIECSVEYTERTWSDGGYGYASTYTESNIEPAPPAQIPDCVTYWDAYYNCETAQWEVMSWGRWVGNPSSWNVSGQYASCATLSQSQPEPPATTPDCN